MKISFFEMEDWEENILKRSLNSNNLSFVKEELSKENVKRFQDSEIISVFIYSKINKEILAQLPKLKLIVTRSTGFDHIDIKECKRRKILVSNIPNYGENTVAEHAFALILSLSRNIHKAYLRTTQNNFNINGLEGFDLKGKRIGVIGTGNIGSHVIRIAKGFEMDVLAFDKYPNKTLAKKLNFKYVSLVNLFKNSDIVSLHVPATKENYHLINKKTLSKFKRGSIIINTARGTLIDTKALLDALDKGIISGAGLDVIEGENMIKEEKELLHKFSYKSMKEVVEDHLLLQNDKVVFTPHIAFYSKEALERILCSTIENINCFIKNKPLNLVN